MTFPWIQVETDFLLSGAADLADVLRTSEAEAGWMMLRLWSWTLSKATGPDDVGVLDGATMCRLAERNAGWKGEPGALLAALCEPAIRLATRQGPEIIRLSGMERYEKVLRKQQKDRERKARGRRERVQRTSSGTAAEVAGKMKMKMKMEKEDYPPPPSATSSPGPTAAADEDLPQAAPEDVALLQSPLLEAEPAKGAASTPEDLQALWNATAHHALPRWQGMSATRRRLALVRLRGRPLEQWRRVVERISASAFCRGDNDRGWKASPDWLLRPDTADRVLEGKYDGQRRRALGPQTDDWGDLLKEEPGEEAR